MQPQTADITPTGSSNKRNKIQKTAPAKKKRKSGSPHEEVLLSASWGDEGRGPNPTSGRGRRIGPASVVGLGWGAPFQAFGLKG